MTVVIVTEGRSQPPTESSGCAAILGFIAVLSFASCCFLGLIAAFVGPKLEIGPSQQQAGATTEGGRKPMATRQATGRVVPSGTSAAVVPPEPPDPPKPLMVAEVSRQHDGKVVKVRGMVTEADAATAVTLDGVLPVTFAASPSPPVRMGQDVTVEGTCYVVAGKPKLGRARVVE